MQQRPIRLRVEAKPIFIFGCHDTLMAEVSKFKPAKPRKIGETEWSDGGLRLSPVRRVVDQGWFLPMIATLPLGAFILIFFW